MDSVAIQRSRVRRKVPYRDLYRAVLAGILLIFVFAAAFYHGDWLSRFSRQKDMSYTLANTPDHALRTGSVLFVPPSGNRCKHSLIDNYTWLIRESGFVACDELARGNGSVSREYTSSPRLDAIRDTFNRKK